MKKLVLAIALCAMAFGSAMAADDVAIYFDAAATDMGAIVSEITPMKGYCVLTDLTAGGVAGFELGLKAEGPVLMSNFAFPLDSGAINVQSAPTFLVGFASALPLVDNAITVMEFDVLVYSANTANWPMYTYAPENSYDDAYEARIYVGEIFFHSLPEGGPCYLDEMGEILPLNIKANDDYRGQPWSTIQLITGPVATDEASWDSVKSLYR